MSEITENIKFDEEGLIPVIVQDHRTDEVLMMAYMNREAFERSVATGLAHYWSRSRKSLWLKGETSGNHQHIKEMMLDCDGDTVLLKVEQEGAACHTGHYSCFFRKLEAKGMKEISEPVFDADKVYNNLAGILQEVYDVILDRKKNPKEGSYTRYLFEKGLDKILKKVGEESAEVIIAAKNKSAEEIKYEVADLFYHIMVLLAERGITLKDIYEELKKRR